MNWGDIRLNRGGQPEPRTWVERPQVKYICIKGIKSHPSWVPWNKKNRRPTLFAVVGNCSVLRDFLSSCLIFLLSVSLAGFARVSKYQRTGGSKLIPTTANMCAWSSFIKFLFYDVDAQLVYRCVQIWSLHRKPVYRCAVSLMYNAQNKLVQTFFQNDKVDTLVFCFTEAQINIPRTGYPLVYSKQKLQVTQ